jgi:hypothetical protein
MDSKNDDSDLVLPNLPAFTETQKREMEEEQDEQSTVSSSASSDLARQKKTNEIDLLKIRSENLIQDFEKLLNKIVLTLRSVCDIIAEFNFYLRKYRITLDYRIKQVRKYNLFRSSGQIGFFFVCRSERLLTNQGGKRKNVK